METPFKISLLQHRPGVYALHATGLNDLDGSTPLIHAFEVIGKIDYRKDVLPRVAHLLECLEGF